MDDNKKNTKVEVKNKVAAKTNVLIFELTNQIAECYRNEDPNPMETMYQYYAKKTGRAEEMSLLKDEVKKWQSKEKRLKEELQRRKLQAKGSTTENREIIIPANTKTSKVIFKLPDLQTFNQMQNLSSSSSGDSSSTESSDGSDSENATGISQKSSLSSTKTDASLSKTIENLSDSFNSSRKLDSDKNLKRSPRVIIEDIRKSGIKSPALSHCSTSTSTTTDKDERIFEDAIRELLSENFEEPMVIDEQLSDNTVQNEFSVKKEKDPKATINFKEAFKLDNQTKLSSQKDTPSEPMNIDEELSDNAVQHERPIKKEKALKQVVNFEGAFKDFVSNETANQEDTSSEATTIYEQVSNVSVRNEFTVKKEINPGPSTSKNEIFKPMCIIPHYLSNDNSSSDTFPDYDENEVPLDDIEKKLKAFDQCTDAENSPSKESQNSNKFLPQENSAISLQASFDIIELLSSGGEETCDSSKAADEDFVKKEKISPTNSITVENYVRPVKKEEDNFELDFVPDYEPEEDDDDDI